MTHLLIMMVCLADEMPLKKYPFFNYVLTEKLRNKWLNHGQDNFVIEYSISFYIESISR